MLEKNKKFAAYWESIGRPQLEYLSRNYLRWVDVEGIPVFSIDEYRIKGDLHWELRREWIESDFTFPIQFFNGNGWFLTSDPTWNDEYQYRKAELTTGDKEIKEQQNPHAALIDAYCDDWKKTNEPWQDWQCKDAACDKWSGLDNHPNWYKSTKYRRKPKTININGFDVPMPITVKPKRGQAYYVADLKSDNYYLCREWINSYDDNILFNRKTCYMEKDSAIIHAKALLSFTDPTQR